MTARKNVAAPLTSGKMEEPDTTQRRPTVTAIDREGLIPYRRVHELTGLSTSELYRLMPKGQFPRSRQKGPNSVAWKLGEVLDWIDALPIVPLKERA